MKRLIIATVVMLAAIATPVSAQDVSQQSWRDYIDAVVAGGSSAAQNAAGEFLPGPMSDAAQLLANSPDVTKAGLELWLNRKMTDAEINGDTVRSDRYQAFFSCVANNDCAKVRELTASAGTAGRTRISSFEPGQNRMGSDYTHYSMNNANPEDCQNSCLRDGQCVAWTYVRPGVQEEGAVCWLKNSVPGLSDDNCCTSGKIDYGEVDR